MEQKSKNFFTGVFLGICAINVCSVAISQNIDKPITIDNLLGYPGPLSGYTGRIIVTPEPGLDPSTATDRFTEIPDVSLEIQNELATGEVILKLEEDVGDDQVTGKKIDVGKILDTVDVLNSNPAIRSAEPELMMVPFQNIDDPQLKYQWHLSMAAPGGPKMPEAWLIQPDAAEIVVAVLDTGIIKDHEDINASRLLAGYDFISNPEYANDNDGRDTDPTDSGDGVEKNDCPQGNPRRENSWHGQHVAGIIGAGDAGNGIGVAGVAPLVKILPVRVLGRCGGTMHDIRAAIRWAAGLEVEGVDINTSPAKIINLSLGSFTLLPCLPETSRAIRDATDAGAIIVTAAGNDSVNVINSTPANCPNVITVGALDLQGRVSFYSNVGEIDVWTSGGNVRRDDNDDGVGDGVVSMLGNSYGSLHGTSMAAPIVTGVIALGAAINPNLTASETKEILRSSSRRLPSSECWRGCGGGKLDAPSFLREVRRRVSEMPGVGIVAAPQ